MHAAGDRPEFAPPPQPGLLRAFALAVLAHLLLIVALTHGLRWQREVQDAAVEAELWSALPQEAAPKPEPVQPAPPPPPPPPVVKAPPQPEPPVKNEADIALEREKQRRIAEQKHQAELEKQRARAEAAKRKREEELALRKLEQQKLAEAKKKDEEKKRKLQEQQEAKLARQREQLREETMKRMQGMAGSGAPTSTGTAARASGPSASWAGRVQARVRPNIVFPDNIAGNPQAIVQVRLGPGGMILGKPRLVKSSGVASWDDAVIRALEKTETLPPDSDGSYPSPVEISFRPKA